MLRIIANLVCLGIFFQEMSVYHAVIIVKLVMELQICVLVVMRVGFYRLRSVCYVILFVKAAKSKQKDVPHVMTVTI